ncbi:MAG: adenosylcobinamide-GDP ribazoletransferase, partial [Methanosphaera sp. rholeuAM130]
MDNSLNQHLSNSLRPSVNGLLGIISFSTRIPITRYITIEQMAGSVMLWPYVGLFIGFVAMIFAYVLIYIFHFTPFLTSALVYAFILWFTGFNHLDGVLDMGDGLMAHGNAKRRLDIMRDSMVGTGGISAFFLVAIITVAAYSSIDYAHLLQVILLAETCSKYSMITSMLYGDDDSKGIGRQIKDGMNFKILLANLVVISIMGYLLVGIAGIVVAFVAIFTGFMMSFIAQRNFG